MARAESYQRWIELYDTVTERDLADMRSLASSLDSRPLVSILMPVVESSVRRVRETIESVRGQAYENWELCVADDSSAAASVRALLAEYARDDDRIRLVSCPEGRGTAAASNSALSIARGDLVALLEQGCVLRPHALLLAVRAFEVSGVGCVYFDEDTIDERGRRSGHHFKPDWNQALFLALGLLANVFVFRAELARGVGGFREELEGSQGWDLLLRISELLPADAIVHVPHVLYHRWAEAEPGSAQRAVRRATRDHLTRTGQQGDVVAEGRHQRVRYVVPQPHPLVSVILPSTGRPDLLEPSLSGLTDGTAYGEIEILVAVGETAHDGAAGGVLPEWSCGDARVRRLALASVPFNYASTVNRVASQARGELLLLLNDDTQVVREGWLETMVGHVLQGRVGAVGARLLYPNGTIQHAGVLLGDGEAHHLYRGRPSDVSGYRGRARLAQDVSAVTGACMLVRREAFEEAGGMDEELAVTYNDIDLCLKLRQAGWRVVVVPDAVLYHRETASFGSLTRGRKDAYRRELARMQARWPAELEIDPMHNPNLALDASHPGRLAFPPRVAYPWSGEALRSSLGVRRSDPSS